MTIVSVSIHAKLQAGIIRVSHLIEQLQDESAYQFSEDQRGDVQAMITGVTEFKSKMQDFPDFSTQTPQQLKILRHDLRNHLNLIGGFAYVFISGLTGEIPSDKMEITEQIHRLSKSLITIVNKIA